MDIINHLNSREKRKSVVEIGCGLGDILRNLKFERKLGFDKQKQVLNALNFLNKFYRKKKRIISTHIEFDELFLKDKYDVIIMVNWIHKIPDHELLNKLNDFYLNNLIPGGEIIIDSVIGNKNIYPYEHNFDEINRKLGGQMKLIGVYSMGKYYDITRKTVSFKKPIKNFDLIK